MADIDLAGRVAIVTGAGGGLGAAHATLLASRGAKVVVNDLHSAQRVVDEIREAGGVAVPDSHDVSTVEGGKAIVETALTELGGLDVVVNNAGVIRDKSFHGMSHDAIDLVLAVHLKGAFNVSQPAFQHMREQGYGRIVNTTSGAGLFGNFGQANYAAAKSGLIGLTRTLAVEGGRRGIKANLIAPMAYTPMTDGLIDEKLAEQTRPELVSPIVAYLASEACPVSGEIFSVGGGKVMRTFIATGPGLAVDPSAGLTVEDIESSWEQIMDISRYVVPKDALEEQSLLYQTTLTAG